MVILLRSVHPRSSLLRHRGLPLPSSSLFKHHRPRPLSSSTSAPPPSIPLSTLLTTLPPPVSPQVQSQCWQELQSLRARLGSKLVVVDDDPTGTQSVVGVPVLADWSVEALEAELRDTTSPAFFILSNVRALTDSGARQVLHEIAQNLHEAQRRISSQTGSSVLPPVSVVSRSDSTLRGHFPLDVECLTSSSHDGHKPCVVLIPFFKAGGRLTINDVHYVLGPDGNHMLPASSTPFAQDKAFGFKCSNLRDWVEEKTGGSVPSKSVRCISLDDIRRGGPEGVRDVVLAAPEGSVLVVNAVEQSDLDVAVLGLILAESRGKHLFFRTAADFVATRAGIRTPPPLSSSFFKEDATLSQGGGLVVVGSYVPKTSEQLHELLNGHGVISPVEMDVGQIINGPQERQAEVKRVEEVVASHLSKREDVVLFTTRKVHQDDGQSGLQIGQWVSDSLVAVVQGLRVRPRFLVAKGGITSNDIATKGLNIHRAMVDGPILPGVPVWACGPESKFPGLKYVVFPGNVGGPKDLLEAVKKLSAVATDKQPPSSPSKGTTSGAGLHVRPIMAGNRTLDMLHKAQSEGRAVGAFNIYNLEAIKAVVLAAQATASPAILQIHPSSLDFGGAPLVELCKAAHLYGKDKGVEIAVHLDHAHQEHSIKMALAQGVDSVMADGSAMAYDKNVEWTKSMTQYAHEKGVPVEAELGRLAGEEDGLSVAEKEAKMTDPDQVPDFINRTGVDMIAVTIGNVHGKYAVDPPVLDFDRLATIRQRTSVPLVLHGASGLPSALVHKAMDMGVCKFNVNTEVRGAYMKVVRGGGKDVLPLMQATTQAMQQVIEDKMKLFGSTSKERGSK